MEEQCACPMVCAPDMDIDFLVLNSDLYMYSQLIQLGRGRFYESPEESERCALTNAHMYVLKISRLA